MNSGIEVIGWRPPRTHDLALEVLSISELQLRGTPQHFRAMQRVNFFVILAVTEGHTRHTIDFTSIHATPGTWLLLHPGQVQRYDFSSPWEGLCIVFRPDLLPPGDRRAGAIRTPTYYFAELASAVQLSPEAHTVCVDLAARMRADTSLNVPASDRNALLLHQLNVLLLRLKTAQRAAAGAESSGADTERFTALRRLIDASFDQYHDVAWYAVQLSCSTKTLTRACLAIAGIPAKRLITERIALEAKRLLVHTQDPVQSIGASLGFDEASNFVKFFTREAGRTPSSFRQGWSTSE